jgi:glycosyltransferase involved in cell wall biosynthesis
MKIAWISSWAPRPCGIATYSADLIDALRRKRANIHIICHTDGGSSGEKNVYPVLDTSSAGWDEKLYTTVNKIKPDIVHIQHEYGLYKTNNDYASGLFRPLFRWKVESAFPVVVTYHSVYTELNKMMSFYMDLMQKIVDAGIVHAEYQWAHLPVNTGRVMDNIYIIPHGAQIVPAFSKEKVKKAQGLEGKKVVGMIGWFNQTKGFHRVLGMWDKLSEKLGSDSVLVLAGDARTLDPRQQEYKKKLLGLAEQSKYKDRIKVVIGNFSPKEYDDLLATFDVMVMPYIFASQSGNLANSFAFGVPVVASAIEGLKAEIEASGAGIAVPTDNDDELQRAIQSIMADEQMREYYSKKARAYVKEHINWPNIAKNHLTLYKNLIIKKRPGEKDLRSIALLEPKTRVKR